MGDVASPVSWRGAWRRDARKSGDIILTCGASRRGDRHQHGMHCPVGRAWHAAPQPLARIIHEGFVNNPGLPDQWPIPPVRKIPDRDGGMTHGGGHTGYPSARTGAVSSCTSDA